MADETKEELQHEVFHNNRMKEEREISDERYAEKRVQHLVYGGAALMLTALLTAIVATVVNSR
jgi:lipopolysaccharide/colanic/teichoic acid biosynthesis glycosyltransferase